MTRDLRVVVVGAGPGGLCAAHELARAGVPTLVLEQGDKPGGLARTEVYEGYRIDIGGHRFYTKVAEVQELWERMLDTELLRVARLSRIHYRGRFFRYPLSVVDVLTKLGPLECLRILASFARARVRPLSREDTFEQWVVNRFGRRLYRVFFQTYTEKVWGIPCRAIRAEWAAQRIKGLSLGAAIANALFGVRRSTSLIESFRYPRLGPGQMWERFGAAVERHGGRVVLEAPVRAIRHDGRSIVGVTVERGTGRQEIRVDQLICSMPLRQLVLQLDPAPPAPVRAAARGLRYRDFVIVTLIVRQADVFPDNWIYIHTPRLRVGRIQNFKNWSRDMVPDPATTSLGMEYFCSRGDDLWRRSDAELIALASEEIHALRLVDRARIVDGCVIRQPDAYPVYDAHYRRHLGVIQQYLGRFANLQTIGRNGMHRYNNQDHSMLCGLRAARNLLGERHDLWQVNTDRSYYEEQRLEDPVGRPIGWAT